MQATVQQLAAAGFAAQLDLQDAPGFQSLAEVRSCMKLGSCPHVLRLGRQVSELGGVSTFRSERNAQ